MFFIVLSLYSVQQIAAFSVSNHFKLLSCINGSKPFKALKKCMLVLLNFFYSVSLNRIEKINTSNASGDIII